ncbi:MAG TPA: DUF4062 domain-containing protein [Pyrinomonadaceae bacterium]|jgi:hypothetical protein|nr:DUF4062 domain-containing protein [Pyrinomonadaceae bacterium]
MAQKKKLQVFVSSTYTDLREERQAAVEAILTAGHIPAGMELFTAGDETQMNVIKRWIDESDVYLLILGGRYGSLEPKSQKSYIHLEYEYAVERSKPLFAVVIEDDYAKERVKTHCLGVDVIETENPHKLKEFRAQVLNKMVRFWRDYKDIKLAILETIADFSRREDLVGWIPGSESFDAGALAEEIARLGKENAALREQVANLSGASTTYNGLTFEEMYRLLASAKIDSPITEEKDSQQSQTLANLSYKERVPQELRKLAKLFGDRQPGLLHAFWQMSGWFQRNHMIKVNTPALKYAQKLGEFGLVVLIISRWAEGSTYGLTESGRQFLLRLMLERDMEAAEQYILKV